MAAGRRCRVLASAAVLYVSELSRAVGVVLCTIGVAALLAAAAVRLRGAWPSRAWFVVVAVVLIALAAYGVWLLIYSANHPPVLV